MGGKPPSPPLPGAFFKKPRGTIHRREEGIPFAGRVFGERRLHIGPKCVKRGPSPSPICANARKPAATASTVARPQIPPSLRCSAAPSHQGRGFLGQSPRCDTDPSLSLVVSLLLCGRGRSRRMRRATNKSVKWDAKTIPGRYEAVKSTAPLSRLSGKGSVSTAEVTPSPLTSEGRPRAPFAPPLTERPRSCSPPLQVTRFPL